MQHLWGWTALLSLGSLTLRFGGTRKKMLVNWISHSSGRYRDPTFGHQKWTFFGFASKKWNHLARTTLTDFVTSRDVTEPIKPVRWRFGLRALALRGGSSYFGQREKFRLFSGNFRKCWKNIVRKHAKSIAKLYYELENSVWRRLRRANIDFLQDSRNFRKFSGYLKNQ